MEEVHKIAARRLSVTLLTDGELDRLLSQAADSQLLTSELFQKSSWEYYEQGLSQLSRDLQGLLEKAINDRYRKKLISELTKDDVVIATLDRRLDLDPPYFRDILDVCLRIASRPVDAASILRYYQAMLFEKVLYPNSKGIALSSVGITPIGVKLASTETE